jgi:hypothetical protein
MLEPDSQAQSASRSTGLSAASIPGGSGLTEGYGDEEGSNRTLGGGVDFFSSLGTERKKEVKEKPDPSKVRWLNIVGETEG